MRAQLTQQMERQAAEEPLAVAIDELADAALKLALNVASECETIRTASGTPSVGRYDYLQEVSVALDAMVTALTQAQARLALRGHVERRRRSHLTIARALPHGGE